MRPGPPGIERPGSRQGERVPSGSRGPRGVSCLLRPPPPGGGGAGKAGWARHRAGQGLARGSVRSPWLRPGRQLPSQGLLRAACARPWSCGAGAAEGLEQGFGTASLGRRGACRQEGPALRGLWGVRDGEQRALLRAAGHGAEGKGTG